MLFEFLISMQKRNKISNPLIAKFNYVLSSNLVLTLFKKKEVMKFVYIKSELTGSLFI